MRKSWQIANHNLSYVNPKSKCKLINGIVAPCGQTSLPPGGTTPPAPPRVMMVFTTIITNSRKPINFQPRFVSRQAVRPEKYHAKPMRKKINNNLASQNMVAANRKARENTHRARGSK